MLRKGLKETCSRVGDSRGEEGSDGLELGKAARGDGSKAESTENSSLWQRREGVVAAVTFTRPLE